MCHPQRYISRLQQLLAATDSATSPHNCDPTKVAAAEAAGAAAALSSLVTWRRSHEDRRALFSHWYWALWCWNKDEMAKSGAVPQPTESVWQVSVTGWCCQWV